MRILFDTNVVLDVLLNRMPHAESAARLLVSVERKQIEGLLSATTITTLHYLIAKAVGATRARKHIETLWSLFDVAPVGREVLAAALSLGFPDYEDAVLREAARRAGATGIVTRDPRGFPKGRMKVYEPSELVKAIAALPAA